MAYVKNMNRPLHDRVFGTSRDPRLAPTRARAWFNARSEFHVESREAVVWVSLVAGATTERTAGESGASAAHAAPAGSSCTSSVAARRKLQQVFVRGDGVMLVACDSPAAAASKAMGAGKATARRRADAAAVPTSRS